MVKHKLLVVDDELFVRELLEEYFSRLDFEVLIANSGPAALKLVAENRFQVALIDLKMSDMDGIEVVRKIRELDKDLVLVLMTGYPTVESSVEAMRAGAYDYVIKPFRLSELEEIIARAIKEYQVRCEINQIKSRLAVVEEGLLAVTSNADSTHSGNKKKHTQGTAGSQDHRSVQRISGTELDVESQLERWGQLLKEGLITQQEFEVNKNRILSTVS